jgi:hypothetical protein
LANCTCICTHRDFISTQPPQRLRFIFPCNCLIFIKLCIDSICAREPPPPCGGSFSLFKRRYAKSALAHCSWVKQARHHFARASLTGSAGWFARERFLGQVGPTHDLRTCSQSAVCRHGWNRCRKTSPGSRRAN